MNKSGIFDRVNRSRVTVAAVCLGIFLVMLVCNLWTDLVADHEWTVVEAAVPDGYTTISDVEGDSTEITNTHTPPTTPDQPHTGADVQLAAWIAVAILGAGLVLLIVAKTALRKRA